MNVPSKESILLQSLPGHVANLQTELICLISAVDSSSELVDYYGRSCLDTMARVNRNVESAVQYVLDRSTHANKT